MFHIAWDVYEGRLLRVHRKLESCKEGAMGSELAVAISNEEAGQGLGEMELEDAQKACLVGVGACRML